MLKHISYTVYKGLNYLFCECIWRGLPCLYLLVSKSSFFLQVTDLDFDWFLVLSIFVAAVLAPARRLLSAAASAYVDDQGLAAVNIDPFDRSAMVSP